MDTSLDLVDHFKLEAEQLPEYTQHTHYKSDRSHGLRRLKVVKRWRKKHDIGEGTFGVVWLEVEEDGSERAVKAISRRLCSYSKIDYKKELAAMAVLSKYEELFVAFQGWFEDPEHIFVAMEYFKHGDLQRHMDTKWPEVQVKIVIAQVLEGLKTMHQLGFTHRDLKPQNIFVVDTDPIFWVKIGDFGITKRILNEQTFLKTEIGTLDYLAPEVLGYVEEETSTYTNAVDLWSLGCICHRLLTMESPFPKMTALTRYCLGMTELPIVALYKSTVTEEAITLVKDLMNAQPSERINAEAALQSLWLKDVESLDSTSAVQSESRLPANPDDGLSVHDAELPQDSKLPETSIETRKKGREPLNIETPSTTRNGQSSPSTVRLKPVLEHRIPTTDVRFPDIPPKEKIRKEYLYKQYDTFPPVEENLMAHLFCHPGHANQMFITCLRAPTKLKEKLTVCPLQGTREGWGIHLVEAWAASRVWLLILFLFLLGTLYFGVCWAILEHDIQRAFGVSSYMITLVAVLVGTAQQTIWADI